MGTSTNYLDNDPNKNKMLEMDEMTQTHEEMDDSSSTSSDSSEEIDTADSFCQTDDIIIIDHKPQLVNNSVMTDQTIFAEENVPDINMNNILPSSSKNCSEFGTNTPI